MDVPLGARAAVRAAKRREALARTLRIVLLSLSTSTKSTLCVVEQASDATAAAGRQCVALCANAFETRPARRSLRHNVPGFSAAVVYLEAVLR